jgi:hypothetical protein
MKAAATFNDLCRTINFVWGHPIRVRLAKTTRVRIVITRGRA